MSKLSRPLQPPSRPGRIRAVSPASILGAVAWAALVLASLSTSAAEPDATPVAAHRAVLGPRLTDALRASADASQRIRIAVSLDASGLDRAGSARRAAIRSRQERVQNALPLDSLEMLRRFEMLSAFAGRATPAAIEALRRHPDVAGIYLDHEVHATLFLGKQLIGADDVQSAGWTGAGVTVAVLDTGIDTDHPDLVDDLVSERCFCSINAPGPGGGCCPSGSTSQSGAGAAEDDDGHGTAVAGIISSAGMSAQPGVAPDAEIVAIKVLDAAGSGLSSDVAAGLDWILSNNGALGVDVVNLSLGDFGEYNNPLLAPCAGTPTANAISMLHATGVTVFAASGNDGHDDGISEPACVADAISVGGVYDEAIGGASWCGNEDCSEILCTDTTGPDVFVCHTNSDEILDILAPNWRTNTSALGGGTGSFGGTSASSPYASGQAALLLESDPTLLPTDVRTALSSNGPFVTNPDNGLSFRRSDVALALASLSVCGDGNLDFGEACDDANLLDGDCCSSSCQFEATGSSCDDVDACTNGDQCDGAGQCIAGPPLDCNDANVCTDDSCDPGLGCVNVDNLAPCDDADACTTADTCSLGVCVGGAPPDCDDTNVCTDDSCDPLLGCVNANNAAACDDGNACTTADACSLGACVGGAAPDCDDADACTDDSCDPGSGCTNVDNSASCDDGDPCTAESCDAVTGCANTPIAGCGPSVPAGSGGSRTILIGLLLISGLLVTSESLRLSRGSSD